MLKITLLAFSMKLLNFARQKDELYTYSFILEDQLFKCNNAMLMISAIADHHAFPFV